MKDLRLDSLGAGGSDNTFTSANKPTPASFGTGAIWIDGVQYWSDGVSFSEAKNIVVSTPNRKILFSSLGDSTLALGNNSGSVTISAKGITATVIRTHGMNVGMDFVTARHPIDALNGHWRVETVVSPSEFTYILDEPVTASSSPAVIINQQTLKAKDPLTLSSIISGGKGVYNGGFAVGASRSDELDSQIDLLLDTDNTQYKRKSDIVFLSSGINDAINDIGVETTKTNVTNAIARLKSEGIVVVVFTQFPLESTYGAWTPERLAESRKYSEWLRQNEQNLGVTLIDAHDLLLDKDDTNGNWLAGNSNDGIHPNRVSAASVAEVIAEKVWLKAKSGDDRNLTSVLFNKNLSGIAGIISGTGAGDLANDFNSFTGGGGSQVSTLSKGNSLTGEGETQRIKLVAAAALDYVYMYKNAVNYTEDGHWYVAKVEMYVASNSVDIRDLDLVVFTNPNGLNKSVSVLSAFEHGSLPVAGKTLTLETPPFQRSTETITEFKPQLRLRLNTVGEATIDIQEFSLIDVTDQVSVPVAPQELIYPNNPITSIDAETWAFTTGAGTSASLVTDHAKKQTNTLRVSTPAVSGVNAYGQAELIAPVDVSNEEFIELEVFSEGVDTPSPTWITLFLFSSAFSVVANYYWTSVAVPKSGWNIIKIRKSAFTNSGGNWSSLTWVRFRVNSSTNSVRTCYLSNISASKLRAKKAVVSLGFDDGNVSQVEAAQLAADRGIKGTFYIVRRLVGTNPAYMNEAELAGIAGLGHELAVHGPSLTYNDWREEFNDGSEEFTATVASDVAYFKTLPGFNTELASYPQGVFSQLVDVPAIQNDLMTALQDAGIKYCRATQIAGAVGSVSNAQYSADYPRSGLLISGGLSLNSSNGVATIKNLIDDAIATGAWIHIYGHKLSSASADGVTYLTNDYIEVLDYLAAKRSAGLVDLSPFGNVVNQLKDSGHVTNSVED